MSDAATDAIRYGHDEFGEWLEFDVPLGDGVVTHRMRKIPAGSFMMGSPKGEGDNSERPQHPVKLSEFWLGETACTQALYRAVTRTDPSMFKGDRRPVEHVSWHDAQAFITKLNALVPGLGARLPNEAEWEYGCRAGTSESRYGELDDIAWYRRTSYGKTRNVGGKQPNPWGLHDTLGNVWEWCADGYRKYNSEQQTNPIGSTAGGNRIIRGGSWDRDASYARAAFRIGYLRELRGNYLGFRLARGQAAPSKSKQASEQAGPRLDGPTEETESTKGTGEPSPGGAGGETVLVPVGEPVLPAHRTETETGPEAHSGGDDALPRDSTNGESPDGVPNAVGAAATGVAAVGAALAVATGVAGVGAMAAPPLVGEAAKRLARRTRSSSNDRAVQREVDRQAKEVEQRELAAEEAEKKTAPVLDAVKQVGADQREAAYRAEAQTDRLQATVEDGIRELAGRLPQRVNVDDELAQVTDNVELSLRLKRVRRDGTPVGPNTVLTWRPKKAPEQPYVLVEKIGSGGFADVWLAYDLRNDGRRVAVKVLHNQHARNESRRKRFYRGARHQSGLDHPNIVKVFEPVCEDAGYCFFVMDYIEGEDLRRAAASGLAAEVVRKLIADIGGALTHAHHRKRLWHRDVKPSNILLDKRMRPYLTDFDLVAAHNSTGGTRTGALGTFVYAAPEAMKNAKNADECSDVFGLGMTAIYALYAEGELPIEVLRDPKEVLDSLPVPDAVRAVLGTAIEWKRERRYSDMPTFVRAWNQAFEPEPRDTLSQQEDRRPHAPPSIIAATNFETGEDMYGTWMRFEVKGVSHRMRWIAPGTFTMGSPANEENRFEPEGPQHKVTLTRGYWLGATPVTQALYEAVMGSNPSHFEGPERPVENVSWNDAQAFVKRLNELVEGLGACLPTEAEWENACRAGTTGSRYGPLGDIAWYGSNSGNQTHDVGGKHANSWGLHDMLGNVWEWCSDFSGAYESEQQTDPSGPTAGERRVFRGGSWNASARRCRAAYRFAGHPGGRGGNLGFRLARGQGGSPARKAGGREEESPASVSTRQARSGATKGRVERDGGGAIELVSEPKPAIIAATSFETGEDMYGTWLRFEVSGVSQRMRWIPPGEFVMGSPEDEEGRSEREGPQHLVRLTAGFWLGETACTQALWEAVMGSNPSRFKGASRPVEQVSWNDAGAFVNRLNELVEGLGARLPTEAEWENACRAGTTGSRYGPPNSIVWHRGNSGRQTHDVKGKAANAWGLHDMLGNVHEWCSDWYGAYDSEQQTDPSGPTAGEDRVFRGGSWRDVARRCRAAYRFAILPGYRHDYLGFRLARGQGR